MLWPLSYHKLKASRFPWNHQAFNQFWLNNNVSTVFCIVHLSNIYCWWPLICFWNCLCQDLNCRPIGLQWNALAAAPNGFVQSFVWVSSNEYFKNKCIEGVFFVGMEQPWSSIRTPPNALQMQICNPLCSCWPDAEGWPPPMAKKTSPGDNFW